jgi:hypothetical protein
MPVHSSAEPAAILVVSESAESQLHELAVVAGVCRSQVNAAVVTRHVANSTGLIVRSGIHRDHVSANGG